MAQKRSRKSDGREAGRDIAWEKYQEGARLVASHPMFSPLWSHARVLRQPGLGVPDDGWATVSSSGAICVHPTRRAEPEAWQYILAHCLLHLGFGHLQQQVRFNHHARGEELHNGDENQGDTDSPLRTWGRGALAPGPVLHVRSA